MPKLYNYLGIAIWFWSNEHDPIHVHARYNNTNIEVLLYVKNGRVSRIIYKNDGRFPKQKEQDLRNFIQLMKENIRIAWIDYFINHKHIDPIIFTRKIK